MKDNFINPFKHIGFKDPATSLMENIIDLHHFIFFFMLVITGLVVWLLIQIIDNYIYLSNFAAFSRKSLSSKGLNKRRFKKRLFLNIDKFLKFALVLSAFKKRSFKDDRFLEACWTLFPAVILIIISLPSFYMLYLSEESINTFLTVKAVGHQWYWTYDYVDLFPCWYNYKKESLDYDDI